MLVDATQLNALVVDIGAATPRMREQAGRLTTQTALDMEATGKGLAPVRTGNLRRSIHTELGQDGLSAEVGTDLEYAPYVEYGTSRMAPQAYMRPAFERHAPEYVAGMQGIVGDSVLGG